MAIKNITYTVTADGISPATEQFAGLQGDHRVTKLIFSITDSIYSTITDSSNGKKAVYRFDIYDGEGGVWSSDTKDISSNTVSVELEERHTRFGGKLTIYLVITVISVYNETEIEFYNFPALIRLSNKPEGLPKEGEDYESISTLAEVAKENAANAAESANAASQYAANAYETVKKASAETVALAKTEADRAEHAALSAENTVKQASAETVALAKTEADRAEQAALNTENTVNQAVVDAVSLAAVEVEKAKSHSENAFEYAQIAKDTLETIAEYKSLSQKNIIDIAEDKSIFNSNLKTNAPEGTEINIYDKNLIDRNSIKDSKEYSNLSSFAIDVITNITYTNEYGTYDDVDTKGVGLHTADHLQYGSFVFEGYTAVTDREHEIESIMLDVYTMETSKRIPVNFLEVGKRYFIAVNRNITADGKYTLGDIYIVEEDSKKVITVDNDGNINTETITPKSVIMLNPNLFSENYNLDLEYVATDFVNKKYIDEQTDDIKTDISKHLNDANNNFESFDNKLNKISEFGNIVDENIIEVSVNRPIVKYKFKTDAPEGAEINIYDKNLIDRNSIKDNKEYSNLSSFAIYVITNITYTNEYGTYDDIDTKGIGLYTADYLQYGSFVFEGYTAVTDREHEIESVILDVSTMETSNRIPVNFLEVGKRYFIAVNRNITADGKYTLGDIYLVEEDSKKVITVDNDGNINTETITSKSVIMLNPNLFSENYNLDFEYVATDFADKEYVDKAIAEVSNGEIDLNNYYTKTEIDEKIDNIDEALENIISIQNSLIGGESI